MRDGGGGWVEEEEEIEGVRGEVMVTTTLQYNGAETDLKECEEREKHIAFCIQDFSLELI